MSKQYVFDLINDSMSPVDLIERMSPWITTEDLLERIEDVVDQYMFDAFEEELEEYYDQATG